MKARRSNKKITPFGGAIPVLKQIKSFKIPELIRECLGTRVKQAKYGYDDIIIAWMLTSLCGGMRLDHITKLRKSLDVIPGLKLPSHDTLGRGMKSLATEVTKTEDVYKRMSFKRRKEITGQTTNLTTAVKETNEHKKLNELLVKSATSTGLLERRKRYTLDVDATLVPTKCFDAKKTYKKFTGFSPMVACIGKLPVYIEMRNGNVNPSANSLKVIENTISLLSENNITIDKIRLDAAGYNSKLMDFIHEKNIKFYIRGVDRPNITKLFKEHTEWSSCELETATGFWKGEIASVNYKLYDGKHQYRLVVTRHKNKFYKGGKNQKEYSYKVIVTNDTNSSPKEVIYIYNQRGTSEQNFDVLKNDFGWRLPPFSNMNENTVFLMIAALTNNVYQAIIEKLQKKVKQVRPNARLREFIYVFMSVACELTDLEYVFYDTNIAYEKIC
jgi:hypothetical protein